MQTLTININAGETKTFQIGGQYIEVLDADGAMDIELNAPRGQIESAIGAEKGTWMKEAFSWFSVKSAITQTIRLLVTGREGGSRRYAGNVTVDGGQLDSDGDVIAESGSAYLGVVQQVAPALTFPRVQIWNGSANKRVLVDSVLIYVDQACRISFEYGVAAAANSVGGNLMANKKADGPAGAAELRHEFPGAITDGFKWVQFAAAGQYLVEFGEPVVLTPGRGLNLLGNVSGALLRANFEWHERG